MMLGLTDPNLLARACDFFVELQARWIEAQVRAGAHAIWLGDCNAFSGMLSVEQYRRFALPSCRRLIQRARQAGAIVHLHNSEFSIPHLVAESELGADILSCGPGVEMAAVAEALSGRCCLSGNLDPIEILLRGSPDVVAREAERIARNGRATGPYLFNTGEMNPRDVPEANMRAMIDAVRQVGAETCSF
jgi:uroporphyrinogen decarboxylase